MSRNLNLHTAAGACHFQHHYLQCCPKQKYSVAVYLLKAPAHTDKHQLIFQYTSQTIKYKLNFVAEFILLSHLLPVCDHQSLLCKLPQLPLWKT